ncbi:MAG: hypothetical protein CMQ49_01175 [Gammaproteobacteria bacterium]|nr:hypothetical protein [Gammaproteobacteria bacterium]
MMMKSTIRKLAGAVLVLAVSASVAASDAMTEQAFAGLMQLEGQWQGTMAKSDGTSVNLQLSYKSKSNGSALLEESSEDGVEMLNIFNIQEGTVVSTHYCGLMNKPVARLVSAQGGVIKFETDAAESGLQEGKDEYVNTWALSLMPEDERRFKYEYTVIRPDRSIITASAMVTRVE